MINLEVGKFYYERESDCYFLDRKSHEIICESSGSFVCKCGTSYNILGHNINSGENLIEEVKFLKGKLEVGKAYVTRTGKIVNILKKSGFGGDQYVNDRDELNYFENGMWISDHPCSCDLISEHSRLTLEVGRFYVNINKKEDKIICKIDSVYVGLSGKKYSASGESIPAGNDLTEEAETFRGEIIIGRKYKTRNNKIVTISRIHSTSVFRYITEEVDVYRENGVKFYDETSERDIVSEYIQTPTLKLEVGKRYKRQDGIRGCIKEYDSNDKTFKFKKDHGYYDWYNIDGEMSGLENESKYYLIDPCCEKE